MAREQWRRGFYTDFMMVFTIVESKADDHASVETSWHIGMLGLSDYFRPNIKNKHDKYGIVPKI